MAEDVGKDAGRAGKNTEHAAADATHAGEDEARSITRDKPAMEATSSALDGGGEFTIEFIHDLSPAARGIVRKLEKTDWVRVSEIAKHDLV